MVGRYLVFATVLVAVCTSCAVGSGAAAPRSSDTISPLTTLAGVTTTTASTTTTRPPAATTSSEPSPEQQRTALVVSATGDVNLDPLFVRTFPMTGYEDAWTGLNDAFLTDDLTIVNLECSPSPLGTAWEKDWNFQCDVAALQPMADAGVEVANLANNHGMDFGMEAMLDGIDNLRAAGIQPVGVGANREAAYAPALFTINGWRVAVIGSGGVNPETGSWIATDDSPGMTSGDDTASIADAIRKAKKISDIVLVTAHWGKSYEATPQPFERRQAEAWVEAGADAVFGHHQHILQPLAWINGKPVAMGLGNFVWQAHPPESRQTGIARVVFEPDGTVTACLIPVFLERNGHPVIQVTGNDEPLCTPVGPG